MLQKPPNISNSQQVTSNVWENYLYLFLLSTIIMARRQDKENLNAQQINNVLFAGIEHQVLASHSASIDMVNVIIFDHNKL